MTISINGTNGLIQAYDYQVLTTAFTYTFAAGTQVLVINPAGTLATGTITMPSAPSDGMTITFISTKQITALTMAGNGATLVSAVTALNANQSVSYIYRATGTSWYPFSTQIAVPFPQSMVRLNTANGFGSTNTVIKRYSTTVTNQGSDITYADSATLGASFTINTTGVYGIAISVTGTTTNQGGISLNSTQLTTTISSITAANRLVSSSSYLGNAFSASVTVYLTAGDVIRPHCDTTATSNAALENFTITRVS
jgi:hypothetical protein